MAVTGPDKIKALVSSRGEVAGWGRGGGGQELLSLERQVSPRGQSRGCGLWLVGGTLDGGEAAGSGVQRARRSKSQM